MIRVIISILGFFVIERMCLNYCLMILIDSISPCEKGLEKNFKISVKFQTIRPYNK